MHWPAAIIKYEGTGPTLGVFGQIVRIVKYYHRMDPIIYLTLFLLCDFKQCIKTYLGEQSSHYRKILLSVK